ncbi:hypothetical protein PIB30_084608 [Stylosanthes scabra]|uniref:Uncharacterized protein n=1 Tax=Stylosanthes scabra TaxID=79078 RepID=A0ABU6YSX7_9FABA|nr:hypothetical protein [Stylosanthes scabra]
MNCRVDRSDPDAAVAPRRYGLDPLLPTPGRHSMSGIRGDILDVTTPLGALPPCLSIDTQLSRPITNATGKLKSRWSVPFTVLKVSPYVHVEIQNDKDGTKFVVNGQILKQYLSEEFDLYQTSTTQH